MRILRAQRECSSIYWGPQGLSGIERPYRTLRQEDINMDRRWWLPGQRQDLRALRLFHMMGRECVWGNGGLSESPGLRRKESSLPLF